MNSEATLTLIRDTVAAFSPHYREALLQTIAEAGFQQFDWFVSFMAYGRHPEPLTAEFFHRTNPYTNIDRQQEMLRETAARGFLENIGDDTYRQTNAGRQGIESFFGETGKAIAAVQPLPAADLNTLADLLQRIVTATETAVEPDAKLSFLLSRRTDTGPDAPATVRIDQYLTDLQLYRDDAHLAAWAPYQVSGSTWETLTFVWQGEANTAAALAEQLSNRHHDESTYAAALSELAQRGWVEEKDGAFQITAEGKMVRETAETQTDEYYFAGWSGLTGAETDQVTQLLGQLRDRLREIAADNAMAATDGLWPLAISISQSLFTLTRSSVDPVAEALGINKRGLPFTLLTAHSLHPHPISGESCRHRFPYSTAESWHQHLTQLADLGLVAPDGDDDYYLTEDGRQGITQLLTVFRNKLGEVTTSLDDDLLEKTAAFLNRIVTSCLNAPAPDSKWALTHSRNLAPAEDAPPLAQIDQLLDDLNAFRDDAHIDAFRPYEIDAHAWELFTFLWRQEVKNAEEMAERAAFRGHTAGDYAQTLTGLVQRGWVTAAGDGAYQLTESGQTIRETAETATDRIFYLPWAALSQAETAELRDCLTQLESSLNEMAAALPS